MSWDSYVDSLMGNSSGVITQGAIIGLNGSIWTPAGSAKIINVSQAEASKIGPLMNKKDDSVKNTFAAEGATVAGTRYLFLRDVENDGRTMTFKKSGVGNLVIASSVQAVIIAFIPEEKGDSARSATAVVGNIVKHLEGSGY